MYKFFMWLVDFWVPLEFYLPYFSDSTYVIVNILYVFGDGGEFQRWTGFIIVSGNSNNSVYICTELLCGKSSLEIHFAWMEACGTNTFG